MTTLHYPSPQFPGLPSVAIDVPEGWEPVRAPGTTMAAKLGREGAFSPNVVVSVEECVPAYDVQTSFAQIRQMAESRDGAISEPYSADLDGRPFVGCDATWPDPDVETILQANLFCVVPTQADAAHLIQVTGAVGGATAEVDYELVRQVIMTTRVTSWDGTRAAGPEGGDASA